MNYVKYGVLDSFHGGNRLWYGSLPTNQKRHRISDVARNAFRSHFNGDPTDKK